MLFTTTKGSITRQGVLVKWHLAKAPGLFCILGRFSPKLLTNSISWYYNHWHEVRRIKKADSESRTGGVQGREPRTRMERDCAEVQHHPPEGSTSLSSYETEGTMTAITLLLVVWVCVTAIAVGTVWSCL